MIDRSAYDVIIFTARKEEHFFIEHFFPHDEDKCYSNVQRVLPDKEWDNLRIGLVNLNDMGNVNSAIKAYEVLERVLPRSVVMVGLAAGYSTNDGKEELRLGDIGLGKQIYYHSYGKKNPEELVLKDKLDVQPPLGWDLVDGQINNNDFMNKVRNRVTSWWESNEKFCKDEWLKWIKDAISTEDFNKYSEQKNPEKDIRAKFVNVSSGELVINDLKYIKLVQSGLMLKQISLFEMESYGLGQVCEKFKIPFYLIKGICDYAGALESQNEIEKKSMEKSGGKRDINRWRAIAGASALCIELLKSSFHQHIVNQSTPKRPGTNNLSECLHPNGPVVCRYRNNEFPDSSIRKCILPGLKLNGTQVAWLCRTFEGINRKKYSDNLNSSFRNLIFKEKAFFTTFFPYSPKNLLHLLQKEKILTQIDQLSIIKENGQSLPESRMKQIINETKDCFSHFYTFNKVSHEIKIETKNFREGQPQIARIIIFDSTEQSESDDIIINDPISMIYPLVLGPYVPTYYAFADKLVYNGEACTPDISYIDRNYSKNEKEQENEAAQLEKKYSDLVAIRFFGDSFTLIISGLKYCSDISEEIHAPKALDNLYSLWEDWCQGVTGSRQYFKKFPMQEIIDKYSLANALKTFEEAR